MQITALRILQVDKVSRQVTETLIAGVLIGVLLFPPYSLPLAIGFLVVTYFGDRLAKEAISQMGFASKAEFKAFKFSADGQALGSTLPMYAVADPFAVDPALSSPELLKAKKNRLTARKISFTGGVVSTLLPVLLIGSGIFLGATGMLTESAGGAWAIAAYAAAVIWIAAMVAAFAGLFVAYAARLKIQRLVIFGG